MKEIHQFISEMSDSSSSNAKKAVLTKWSKNDVIKTLLNYTYNPYKQYGLKSKQLKKRQDLHSQECIDNIWVVLDLLACRAYTGHDAIAMVNGYMKTFCTDEDKEVIYKILDRNLEFRAGTRLINKVIPGVIPTFDVALAEKYDEKHFDVYDSDWYASRKLDGVRCIIRKEGDKVTAFSRKGKEFHTLAKVLREVSFMKGDFVLDGEVCIVNDLVEDFQGIMKEIRKKNHTITNPRYFVFDKLTLEEFDSGTSTRTLSERFCNTQYEYDTVTFMKQIKVSNHEHLQQLCDVAEKNGYEGMMVRKDTTYQGKRSRDIMKCKKFYDAEYTITGAIMDEHRVVRNGKEVTIPMLSAVTIEHKGCLVKVGSGWSQEERIKYHANPELIIGQEMTVQYFEESQDKSGEWSLRFPVKKIIHFGGRKV